MKIKSNQIRWWTLMNKKIKYASKTIFASKLRPKPNRLFGAKEYLFLKKRGITRVKDLAC